MKVSDKLKKRLLLALLLSTAWDCSPVAAREQKTLTLTTAATRGGDTYIDSSATTSNFGTATNLNVAGKNSGANPVRALIQFDLTSLPSIGVKQAKINLFVSSINKAGFIYEAHLLTSLWTESGATWANRLATTAWATAGGVYNATASSSLTPNNTTDVGIYHAWDITADAQSWYSGTQNFGHLFLQNQTHGNDATGININSREAATNNPQIALTFLQQISSLNAAAGNGSVALSWTNPTPISGSTVLEAYTGVLILRQQDKAVAAASVPADGTTYSQCSTIGSNNDVVVFVSTSSATTFTDSGVCGGLTNDHLYFYKVFALDAATNYSTECGTATSGTGACSANGSAIVPEVTAVPSATAPYHAAWVFNTLAGSLSSPGVDPGASVVTASNALMFDLNPQTGAPVAPPIGIGGAVAGRPVLIDGPDDSIGHNVAYVPAQDNFVYAANTDTGSLDWVVNPGSVPFVASAGIQAKLFSGASYILAQDLVVVGTHNAGSTSANQIFGLNGNSGATVWTFTGGGLNPSLDIISSAPSVDYVHGAIWVTSRSNGGTSQPSLWKLNPNTGVVLFSAKLGPIDYSPTLSPQSDVLFVSVNGGALTAIDPVTGSTLGSINPGDGGVKNSPAVATASMPYTVVLTTNSQVWSYQFSCLTNPCLPGGGTFTKFWGGTAINNPSAPLTYSGLTKVYVGGGDGKIHELDLATGVDAKQRLLNTSVTVGDVGIDTVLSLALASASDGRCYAFAIPF